MAQVPPWLGILCLKSRRESCAKGRCTSEAHGWQAPYLPWTLAPFLNLVTQPDSGADVARGQFSRGGGRVGISPLPSFQGCPNPWEKVEVAEGELALSSRGRERPSSFTSTVHFLLLWWGQGGGAEIPPVCLGKKTGLCSPPLLVPGLGLCVNTKWGRGKRGSPPL